MSQQQQATAPAPVQTSSWSGTQWTALLGLSFAVFMVSLDVTVVVVSLGRIQHDLGLSQSELQWVVTAYSAGICSVLLSAGVLADRFGRRQAFFFGLILFALASGAAGLADRPELLNVARAVQGWAQHCSLAVPARCWRKFFPGSERTKAFGVWGTVNGHRAWPSVRCWEG